MKKISSLQKNIAILVSMLVISFLYVYLFFRTGTIFVGHDRIFHIERMEEIYQILKSGHIYNQISTYSTMGVGVATGRFYPSVNLVIYAIIRLVIHNPIQSFYGFLFLETLLGLLIAYYAGYIFFQNKRLAYLFAIQLRLSTYVMHNDFQRFDVGESWALIFVPLSLIGFYLILKEKRSIKGVLLLSLGISLELYSHILTAIITVVSVIIMYILYIILINNKDLKKLISLLLSFLITGINTLIITIPLLDYYLNVGVVEPDKIKWNMYDFSMQRLINASIENTINFPNIGIVGVIAIILMIIIVGKKIKDDTMNVLAIYLIAFLMLVTNLFPWNLLTNTPINIIQFPWRFLVVLVPLISIGFVYFLDKKIYLGSKQISIIVILNIIITIAIQNSFIQNEYKSYSYPSNSSQLNSPWAFLLDKNNYYKALSINSLEDGDISHDYTPKKSDKVINSIYDLEISQNDWKRKLQRKEIKRAYHQVTYSLENLPKKSGEMKIPFLIYRDSDYQLYINGTKSEVKSDRNSQLVIKKDNKSKLKIEIKYIVPVIHKVLLVVSSISIIINMMMLLWMDYKNKLKRLKYERK